MFRSLCVCVVARSRTRAGEQHLQGVSHGDQVQDVQVVVGRAEGRGLQVHSLLLVEGWNSQHQPHLGPPHSHHTRWDQSALDVFLIIVCLVSQLL